MGSSSQLLLISPHKLIGPGKCFRAQNAFRIVFCASPDKLTEAYRRLDAFCQRHRSNKRKVDEL